MLFALGVIVVSSLCGSGHYEEVSVSGDVPVGSAAFRVGSDQVILIHDAIDEARLAESQEGPDQREVLFEEQEQVQGGWISRVCGGLRRWWKGASWKKRIVWLAVGSTAAVGLGAVWLNGGYYLVFKSINDYWTHFGVSASGDIVSSSTGMVLVPTSSEVATSIMESVAGATTSAALTPTLVKSTPTAFPTQPLPSQTPTARPPLTDGICELVDGVEKFQRQGNCDHRSALYRGRCIRLDGCTFNGMYLYSQAGVGSCLCPRACNAPPGDLPCFFYVSEGVRGNCIYLPMCDGSCPAHWCHVCSGDWHTPSQNVTDPYPSASEFNAWLRYHNISQEVSSFTERCFVGQ